MATADTALSFDGRTLMITGVLDFKTVPLISNKGDQFIHDVDQPVFNLQGVTKAESSALALLTSWRRKSHQLGKVVLFIHVPSDLMDIAKLSNVEGILGLSDHHQVEC